MEPLTTAFAPQLNIPSGTFDVSFYEKAFGALEQRRWTNDDGSVHVVEFRLNGVLFHLHEENPAKMQLTPAQARGTTTTIGLMVPDVHSFVQRALGAGAESITPVTDYDYGYRQGDVRDPFGHTWMIEQRI